MTAWETLNSPTWSPDGDQLVLTLERYALEAPYPIIGSQLAVVSATGRPNQRPSLITDVSLAAYAPHWHPTDDLIAFSTRNPDSYPTAARSDVYTVRTDGSDLRRLTEAPAGVTDRYLAPTWTADGARLAVTIAYVSTGAGIVTMVPAFLPATGGRPAPLNDTGRGTDVKPRPARP